MTLLKGARLAAVLAGSVTVLALSVGLLMNARGPDGKLAEVTVAAAREAEAKWAQARPDRYWILYWITPPDDGDRNVVEIVYGSASGIERATILCKGYRTTEKDHVVEDLASLYLPESILAEVVAFAESRAQYGSGPARMVARFDDRFGFAREVRTVERTGVWPFCRTYEMPLSLTVLDFRVLGPPD